MATDRPPFHSTITDNRMKNRILSYLDFKQNEELKKTLKDANLAGTANSGDCTLILTLGDYAKAFAMSGLSVVGQDYYGLFPLREDAEIQNIKKILGLQHGKIYENAKELRYGHLMIMAYQDDDGSHFKGLLINFLHSFWPSLLKVPNFMRELITPILLVKKTKQLFLFYTVPEYWAWVNTLRNKTYRIKYYKELKTVKREQVKKYFADLDHHIKDFVWVDDEDGDAIELAFSKKKIEARMDWLRAPQDGTYIDSKEKRVRYRDFINKEFKQYLVAHLQRSIPSLVDGLKSDQRKILFCAFKKPIILENDVFEFSRYVSVHSAYHHGEASLVSTIKGMARNYVGSNNINLFQMGGYDHASGRFIFTQLSPITRYLFHKADELVLNYLNDDGRSIEPAWFIPIIPMVLVNGSAGTGPGWSSFIPKYNPRDIIANLKRLLYGEAMVPMHPWYKGFKGTIQTASKDSTTEYPGWRWIREYDEFLKAASQHGKDKTPLIKAYKMHNGKIKNTSRDMRLFDANGEIKKYDTPEQILEDFFKLRLYFYERRRIVRCPELKKAILLLENKVKFIDEVLNGNINIFNREDDEICADLMEKDFKYLPKEPKETEPTTPGREEYDHLLSMTVASFTDKKKIEQLKKEIVEKNQELDELTKSTSVSLWLRDLEALDHQLEKEYPLAHMPKINNDESSPEIAEEAPEKKTPAKRAAAGPQGENKKKQRCD